jgi:hypothetical protein
VLQGLAPNAFAQVRGGSRLIVPLRVAGEVHGALVFSAAPPSALEGSHLDPAQRLADIVGAHLELLRRAAVAPAQVQGWPPTAQPPGARAHPATPPRSGASVDLRQAP